MKLVFTALRIFGGVFALWVVLLIIGIGRASAGLASQQPADWISSIGDLSERIIFAPQSLFGNSKIVYYACFVWVFLLCLAASALYHWVRSNLRTNEAKR